MLHGKALGSFLTPTGTFLTLQATIVEGWQNPESEMVAYRSFRPFFPLMDVRQVHAVQLWAVWAIHHVCSKNREFLLFIHNFSYL